MMQQSEFYKLISYLGSMIFITGCILLTYSAQNRENLQYNLVFQLIEETSNDPFARQNMTKNKKDGIENPLEQAIKPLSQGLRNLLDRNTNLNIIIILSGAVVMLGALMLIFGLAKLHRLIKPLDPCNTD